MNPTQRSLALSALFIIIHAPLSALTVYVGPGGRDSNPGTSSQPFKSLKQAEAVVGVNGTVVIFPGTYTPTKLDAETTLAPYLVMNLLSVTGVRYMPEDWTRRPVFNFSYVPADTNRVCAFFIKGNSVKVEGISVTGVRCDSQKQSDCFRVTGDGVLLNYLDIHNNQAVGVNIFTGADGTTVSNCDAYNNGTTDPASYGNIDGFGSHAGATTFTACRAWNNSDDGFDCITSIGSVVFDHCWAYYQRGPGDKNGFKVGGYGSGPVLASPPPVHRVSHCLAASNAASGFYANHQPGQSAVWENNTTWYNGLNYNMLERRTATKGEVQDLSDDIDGIYEYLRLNIAYPPTNTVHRHNASALPTRDDNNSWNSGRSVTPDDFWNDNAPGQMTWSRQSNGALPVIGFMAVRSGSDLAGFGR